MPGLILTYLKASHVHGDKAYNNYEIEDILADVRVKMQPIRKSNFKRSHSAWRTYLCEYSCKRVETAGSLIERLPPKSIHTLSLAIICNRKEECRVN